MNELQTWQTIAAVTLVMLAGAVLLIAALAGPMLWAGETAHARHSDRHRPQRHRVIPAGPPNVGQPAALAGLIPIRSSARRWTPTPPP